MRAVRSTPGVGSAAPRLSLPASLILDETGDDGLPNVQSMRLFGVEPESASLATGFDLTEGRYPRGGAELTLEGGTAESAGLQVGDEVQVGTPEGPERLELVGLLRIPGGSFGGVGFGMAPMPYTQRAFDKAGEISGISIGAAEEVSLSELRQRLDRKLGDGFDVERSSTRTEQVSSQL